MSAKHTPGPWHIRDENPWLVYAADGHLVAELRTFHGMADARLIAAAPDMLEALKLMLKWADACFEKEVLDAARSAIAKAKGENHE